jgi:O-antigen/teichoic acid export membrane protein
MEASTTSPRGVMTNAGWNVFNTLWGIGIGFLLTPLMIHYLGVQRYGTLLLIWSITGVLGIVNFGLGEATLRYVAHYHGGGDLSGVNRVFSATLSFNMVMCGIVIVGMFFSAPVMTTWLKIPHDDYQLVTLLLRLAAVVFSLGLIGRAYSAIPMALMRYDISSKINIGQNVVRSVGYIILLITKFGILYLLLWDMITSFVVLCIQLYVARWLMPGLKRMPAFSFSGLREIIGYSVFSFLTYVFLMLHREAGKLVLGRFVGPTGVAYLGTPDNVAQRVHMVVASGSETLLPRFSASRDSRKSRELFLNGVWGSLAVSIVLLVPLIVLMEDFLSLWINAEFASESARAGKLVALGYISQGAFAPAATYFRGSGKPWFVTLVIFFAGFGTLGMCLLLIPSYGVLGAGYAYALGSIAHLLGVTIGWVWAFRASSVPDVVRYVGVPLVVAAGAFFLENFLRSLFLALTWPGFISLGALFVCLTAILIFGTDRMIGGVSPSKEFLQQLAKIHQVEKLTRYIRKRRQL